MWNFTEICGKLKGTLVELQENFEQTLGEPWGTPWGMLQETLAEPCGKPRGMLEESLGNPVANRGEC